MRRPADWPTRPQTGEHEQLQAAQPSTISGGISRARSLRCCHGDAAWLLAHSRPPPTPNPPHGRALTVSTTRPSASWSRNLRVPSGEDTLWCSTDLPVRTPCTAHESAEPGSVRDVKPTLMVGKCSAELPCVHATPGRPEKRNPAGAPTLQLSGTRLGAGQPAQRAQACPAPHEKAGL